MSSLRYIKLLAGSTVVTTWAGAWWYRPIGDNDTSSDGSNPTKRSGLMSKYSVTDYADKDFPITVQLASFMSIAITTAISRVFLYIFGNYNIINDKNYYDFIKDVMSRDHKQPLITVSNHRSLLDDPLVFTGFLPFGLAIQPKYNRYSICAQEYCYNNKVCYYYLLH